MLIAITGSRGFIGRHVHEACLAAGHTVEQLDRNDNKTDAEVIFHLSAYGQYPSMTSVEQCWNTNVLRTNSLLANRAKMIYAGTSVGEDDKPPYGRTKAIASRNVRFKQGVVLRLFSVYGPGELETRLMPMVVAMGLRGKFPDFADANAAHDFVYVQDVAQAFLAAIDARPGAYDIGTGQQTTIAEVADVAAAVFGITEPPVFDRFPRREWDRHEWVADPKRAQEEFGWKAKTTLAEGLRNMAATRRSQSGG